MQPQYPEPQHQPNYDFIMNPQAPKKWSPLGLGGGSGNSKQLIMIVVGVVIFIILLFFIGSLLTHKNGAGITQLTTIAQEQNELVRVATLAGTGSAEAQSTKNFAQTATLSLTSSQADIVSLLAKNGKSLGDKQLKLLQNPATDSALTSATAASDFDKTFETTMASQLKTYSATLQQTYAGATNPGEKQLLQADYNGAALLLQQMTQQEY